jgi:outer membrane protein TolC
LPLERTAARNRYREAWIGLEAAVRQLQELEDDVKGDVRGALRDLVAARESVVTQAKAVVVAQRRVDSTDMLLQAGRAEIRDVLEAQTDLVDAQNEYTTALVEYRVAELELQRDTGLLSVSHDGIWREYDPAAGGEP